LFERINNALKLLAGADRVPGANGLAGDVAEINSPGATGVNPPGETGVNPPGANLPGAAGDEVEVAGDGAAEGGGADDKTFVVKRVINFTNKNR
jgi:hypothetical protein